MKQKLALLFGGLLALSLPLSVSAEQGPAPIPAAAVFGPEIKWSSITEIKIVNYQNEPLGRIEDLGIDLTHGRVVVVLVVSDQVLGIGGRIVAVPPSAMFLNSQTKAYQIDASAEKFKAAPAFQMAKWNDSTENDDVTAAYRYFGQVPNFLVGDEKSGRTMAKSGRLVTDLGIVQRMSKLSDMQVVNASGERVGRLQSLILDVPKGKVLKALIQVASKMEGNKNTELRASTEVSPSLLTFNDARDTLILDVSKVEYADQPRVIFEHGADGQVISFKEQVSPGVPATALAAPLPPAIVPLMQGTNYKDVTTTVQIYKSIRDSNLDPTEKVEVGTNDGKVTLRGIVKNDAAKKNIGAIAIIAVKVANVDNQLVVMTQPAAVL